MKTLCLLMVPMETRSLWYSCWDGLVPRTSTLPSTVPSTTSEGQCCITLIIAIVIIIISIIQLQQGYTSFYYTSYSIPHFPPPHRCITIRYTSPSSYVFIRPAIKLMPIARKLLSLLRDMSLDDHPVFFHMFSNNGSVLYYYLTQAMAEPAAPRITVKGCIFDSTPAPRRIFSGSFVFLACIVFDETPQRVNTI